MGSVRSDPCVRARGVSKIVQYSQCCDGRWMSKKKAEQAKKKSALRKESDRALVQQIQRLLALPPNKRTHFLRVRLPNGGSAL